MRNWFLLFLVVSLFCVTNGIYAAQANVKTKNAIDLQLYGQLDMSAIYHNNSFHNMYWGPALKSSTNQEISRADGLVADGRRIAPNIGGSTGSMFIFDPQLTIGLQATLPSDVIAVIELSTPFYVIGDEGGSTSIRKKDLTYRQFNYHRNLEVEQAYVELRDLFVQDSGLDVRLGITDYALDFRGNGNPFLIDVQNAENPFLSVTGSQQYLIVDSNGVMKWDMDSTSDKRIDPGPYGRNTQDAAGVLAKYTTDRGLIGVDAYLFDIYESYESNHDDFVLGSTLTYHFDEDRKYGKIAPTILLMSNDSKAVVYTAGSGAQFYPVPDILEVYGEAYYQWGTYAKNVDVLSSGGVPADHFSSIVQNSYAFYVGMRLGSPRTERETFSPVSGEEGSMDVLGGWQPYIDLSYWELRGDTKADDHENSNFVSLENNNLTLIAESAYWGLDIDTNYRAFRVQTGCYPVDSLKLEGSYAYLEYQKNNGSVDNHFGRKPDKIGDELDVTLNYEYSAHVKFRLGTGFLLDSRALGSTKGMNMSLFQVVVDF